MAVLLGAMILAVILLWTGTALTAGAVAAVFWAGEHFGLPALYGLVEFAAVVAGVCWFFYMAVRLMFFLPTVVVAEGGLGLARSWELGAGNFWRNGRSLRRLHLRADDGDLDGEQHHLPAAHDERDDSAAACSRCSPGGDAADVLGGRRAGAALVGAAFHRISGAVLADRHGFPQRHEARARTRTSWRRKPPSRRVHAATRSA